MKLLTALDSHAANRGGDTFLTLIRNGEVADYSFAGFRDNCLRFASAYEKAGIGGEGVIFIVLKHCAELYFSFVGAMYAGAIPSFLPFPTPKQDANIYWSAHEELFHHVKPRAIISYAENLPHIARACEGLDVRILDISGLDLSEIQVNPAPLQQDDHTAFLQHSSGTTGLKKGVMLSYGKVAAQIDSYGLAIGLTSADTVVSWLPLYHDMGLISCMITPITIGARLVSIDAFEWVSRPVTLLQAIEDYRGNFTWLPNFAFNLMAQTRPRDSRFDLSSLKGLIGCSEPNKTETFDRFHEVFADCGLKREALRTCYAMAETVFAVSQSATDTVLKRVCVDRRALEERREVKFVTPEMENAVSYLSNGPVIDGLSVRIRTEKGYETGEDSTHTGEIQVAGRFVFDGYYKNQAGTDLAMDGDYYSTGDIGFFAGGELYVCGRTKEVLIINGRNYYANDIEDTVNGVVDVKRGRNVAFSVFEPRTQSEAALVVAETDITDPEARRRLQAEIKTAVFSRLELTLQKVVLVDAGWLIKTTSGKISRKENLARYREMIAAPKN